MNAKTKAKKAKEETKTEAKKLKIFFGKDYIFGLLCFEF